MSVEVFSWKDWEKQREFSVMVFYKLLVQDSHQWFCNLLWRARYSTQLLPDVSPRSAVYTSHTSTTANINVALCFVSSSYFLYSADLTVFYAAWLLHLFFLFWKYFQWVQILDFATVTLPNFQSNYGGEV
jgi:hypothetical protein